MKNLKYGIRNSPSIFQFTGNLLVIIRPRKNPTFNISDILLTDFQPSFGLNLML